MRSDDLVPVLAAAQGRGLSLKLGVVDAWNTTTGANTITVGSTTLTNVKVIGSVAGIAAGNHVMILADGSAWYVLGKLTRP